MTFDRETLFSIEAEARKASRDVVNEDWKRAYEELAYACNVLDAFVARSSVTPSEPPPQPVVGG